MENSRNTNAWVRAYEFIKDKIIRGDYSPGEKLNEREIVQLVHVSRTPTREALKKLEYEGFINNIPRKGVFVKKYSPEELDTLHKMLILLEGLAVEMATLKLSESDLKNLQEMTNRMRSLASKKKYEDYLTLNFEFHLFFAKMTESKELIDTISHLRSKVFRFIYSHITLAHNTEQFVNDHQDIIDALKGNINKRPKMLMEKHVDRARKSFLDFYKKFR